MESLSNVLQGVLGWMTSLPIGEWLAELIALGCVVLLVRKDLDAATSMKVQCDLNSSPTSSSTSTNNRQSKDDSRIDNIRGRNGTGGSIEHIQSSNGNVVGVQRNDMRAGDVMGHNTIQRYSDVLENGLSVHREQRRVNFEEKQGNRCETGGAGQLCDVTDHSIVQYVVQESKDDVTMSSSNSDQDMSCYTTRPRLNTIDEDQLPAHDVVLVEPEGDRSLYRRNEENIESEWTTSFVGPTGLTCDYTDHAFDDRPTSATTSIHTETQHGVNWLKQEIDELDIGGNERMLNDVPGVLNHSSTFQCQSNLAPPTGVLNHSSTFQCQSNLAPPTGVLNHSSVSQCQSNMAPPTEQWDVDNDYMVLDRTRHSQLDVTYGRAPFERSTSTPNRDSFIDDRENGKYGDSLNEYRSDVNEQPGGSASNADMIRSLVSAEYETRILLLEEDNSSLRAVNETLTDVISELRTELCQVSDNYKRLVEETEKGGSTQGSQQSLSNDVVDNLIVLREPPQGASSCNTDYVTSLATTQSKQIESSGGVKTTFQVICMGDSGVGKTSFVRQLCHSQYNESFRTTISVDFAMKTFYLDGRHIQLQLWDTAGQERYRSLTKQYLRKADGILLFYDVTSETSFKNVRHWMASIEEGATEGTIVCIVGNKRDLVPDSSSAVRAVTRSHGALLAEEYGAVFHETSAKTGEGILEPINDIVSLLVKRWDNVSISSASSSSEPITLRSSVYHSEETMCCSVSSPGRRRQSPT